MKYSAGTQVILAAGARMERMRIRRLIAPHLDRISGAEAFVPAGYKNEFLRLIKAIDTATRAPRKVRGKR